MIPAAHEDNRFDQAMEQPTGLRSAALVAHAMEPGDRRWLLSRLDPGQRAALQPLLDELTELAIPPDADLVSEALRAQRGTPPGAPRGDDDIVERFSRLSAQTIASVLAKEPRSLADRVLQMRPWPWCSEVLALLGVSRGAMAHTAADQGIRVGFEIAPTRLERMVLVGLLARAAAVDLAEPGLHRDRRDNWAQRLSPQWLRRARGAAS